jgi:hypothetical protein
MKEKNKLRISKTVRPDKDYTYNEIVQNWYRALHPSKKVKKRV